eukprot:scaffold1399_cov410-Prasinococcus_capsulatus_cf.AAC.2
MTTKCLTLMWQQSRITGKLYMWLWVTDVEMGIKGARVSCRWASPLARNAFVGGVQAHFNTGDKCDTSSVSHRSRPLSTHHMQSEEAVVETPLASDLDQETALVTGKVTEGGFFSEFCALEQEDGRAWRAPNKHGANIRTLTEWTDEAEAQKVLKARQALVCCYRFFQRHKLRMGIFGSPTLSPYRLNEFLNYSSEDLGDGGLLAEGHVRRSGEDCSKGHDLVVGTNACAGANGGDLGSHDMNVTNGDHVFSLQEIDERTNEGKKRLLEGLTADEAKTLLPPNKTILSIIHEYAARQRYHLEFDTLAYSPKGPFQVNGYLLPQCTPTDACPATRQMMALWSSKAVSKDKKSGKQLAGVMLLEKLLQSSVPAAILAPLQQQSRNRQQSTCGQYDIEHRNTGHAALYDASNIDNDGRGFGSHAHKRRRTARNQGVRPNSSQPLRATTYHNGGPHRLGQESGLGYSHHAVGGQPCALPVNQLPMPAFLPMDPRLQQTQVLGPNTVNRELGTQLHGNPLFWSRTDHAPGSRHPPGHTHTMPYTSSHYLQEGLRMLQELQQLQHSHVVGHQLPHDPGNSSWTHPPDQRP